MNRIKEMRIASKFSQKDLAEMIGCNQTAVGKYEREDLEPNLDTLKKLSSIFECSIDYLVGNSDDFGVVQTATNYALTALESEMLSHFRKLDVSSQHKAIGYVYALSH